MIYAYPDIGVMGVHQGDSSLSQMFVWVGVFCDREEPDVMRQGERRVKMDGVWIVLLAPKVGINLKTTSLLLLLSSLRWSPSLSRHIDTVQLGILSNPPFYHCCECTLQPWTISK